MSRTHFSAVCETNKATGKPQENIYFMGAFRKPEDYRKTFVRSSGSEAPFQVFAVFSARGKDDIAASALQKIMSTFGELVAQTQSLPNPVFEDFSTRAIRILNDLVCNISLNSKGTPLKVSFTAAVIIHDVLRIISIGNTSAYLVRNSKVIRLSEDQTVARRYVQMGAITPEEERTHPESDVLTQYLGKFQQDGPLIAETKTSLKIGPNDEIMIVGAGISRYVASNVLGYISTKNSHPQIKAEALIKAASEAGAKGGMTALVIHVLGFDSAIPATTSQNPAKAADSNHYGSSVYNRNTMPSRIQSNHGPKVNDGNSVNSGKENTEVEEEEQPMSRKRVWIKRLIAVLIPIVLFFIFAFIGYFSTYALIKARKIDNDPNPNAEVTVDQEQSLNKVMYSISDQVPVYSDESTKSTILQYLVRGEAITLIAQGGTFSKIFTAGGNTGFVVSIMISETDPTIGDDIVDMTADPTPIPEYSKPTTTEATEPTDTKSTEKETTATTTDVTETSPETTSPTTSATTPTTETSGTSETSATTATTETSGTTP